MSIGPSSQHWPECEFTEAEERLDRIEPAWAKAAHGFRTGVRSGHHARSIKPRTYLAVKTELDVFRSRAENGDTLALLHAVSTCAHENLPLPAWLALAYNEAFAKFVGLDGEAGSLDQVFRSKGMPAGTSKRMSKARKDWQTGNDLRDAAWEAAWKDESLTSIDAVLKKILAEGRFAGGLTTAKRLVKEVDDDQREFTGSQSLSDFLSKRRKQ